MAKLAWDAQGERTYETGVDRGVLYVQNFGGGYADGVPWNGLTAVSESPSGAEATPLYADNIKYLNLISAEEFGASIEAFTYPEQFGVCDGTAAPAPGITVGQQRRTPFGLSYRTLVGNDVDGSDHGYKIHLVYGAQAAPSERAYATVNDSPEAITFSWEVTTTPVEVPGLKPSAQLTIDSTKVDSDTLKQLEDILYGSENKEASLPTPTEILALFAGTIPEVTAAAPTSSGNVITIPNVTGVIYKIDGIAVNGTVTITEDTLVTAETEPGYKFSPTSEKDWFFAKV